jgi:hypothetical protein
MNEFFNTSELGFEPGSLLFLPHFQSSVFQSSKDQAPSSREAPSFKHQEAITRFLDVGVWNFSGAWMLVFGASPSHV